MQTFKAGLLRDVDYQTTEVYESITRIQDDLKAIRETSAYIKDAVVSALSLLYHSTKSNMYMPAGF